MTPADTNTMGGSTGSIRDELSQDASRLGHAAEDRARQEANTRKGQAADQAKSTASALDRAAKELEKDGDTPDWLSSAFRQTASGIERLASSVEGRSPDQLAGDLSKFARQSPTTFLAASAAAGFAAARFFRAGAEYKNDQSSAQSDRARLQAGGGYGGDFGTTGAASPGYGSTSATMPSGSSGTSGAGYASADRATTSAPTKTPAIKVSGGPGGSTSR